jgi:metallo-beta-lactamase family protein
MDAQIEARGHEASGNAPVSRRLRHGDGAKHQVTVNGRRILLDCGFFQGLKALRLRNWQPPPFDPHRIDAVVLSHAHIDHSGYLPLLVCNGFHGPIFCTPGTATTAR